jgi:hypothetical protein
MNSLTLILLLLSISLTAACKASNGPPVAGSSSPSPSPSPLEDTETRIGREEAESQGDLSGASRTTIRAAARQYVKEELTDWTLKGMASQASYEPNVFLIDVDLEKGKQHRVLSLIVEQFFPENGARYWKAFPLDKNHASQLQYARDASKEGELEDANDKLSGRE